MRYFADLHIHSHYSRATSKTSDLQNLSLWAQRKGVQVLGTGDFTHPGWMRELRTSLVPAEPGLFRLRPDLEQKVAERLPRACRLPTRFVLQVEISTVYKAATSGVDKHKTRKVHHLVYSPDFDSADRLIKTLSRIGNLASDGRPILKLDSRELLELTLDSGEDTFLIPAHIWTPWFSALGSKSGFDSIDECYGDLSEYVFAVETGLSSDPSMNWRVSSLDRFRLISSSDAHSPSKIGREAVVFDTKLSFFALRDALRRGKGYVGTVEFFSEEGKYHLDGHRKCGVRSTPADTIATSRTCPACKKPVTVGVLHRVTELQDRSGRRKPKTAGKATRLVSLAQILGELHQVGPESKKVTRAYDELVGKLGPELPLLMDVPLRKVSKVGSSQLAEAIRRLRAGRVSVEPGYDGLYGTVRLFSDGELPSRQRGPALFEHTADSSTTRSARANRSDSSHRERPEALREERVSPQAKKRKPHRPTTTISTSARLVLGAEPPKRNRRSEKTNDHPVLLLEAGSENEEAALCAAVVAAIMRDPARAMNDNGVTTTKRTRPFARGEIGVMVRTPEQSKELLRAFRGEKITALFADSSPLLDQPGVQEILGRRDHAPHSTIPQTIENAFRSLGRERNKVLRVAHAALQHIAAAYADDPWAFEAFDRDVARAKQIDTAPFHEVDVAIVPLASAATLSFRVGVIPGCEQGLLPYCSGPPPTDREVARDRKLFAAGMSRATERLILALSRTRKVSGKQTERAASPFLSPLLSSRADARKRLVRFDPAVLQAATLERSARQMELF